MDIHTPSSKKMHQAYPIGTVCITAEPCMGNPAGSRCIVYDHYSLSPDHHGVCMIFPNANYDGFSEECMEVFEVNPIEFSRYCMDYQFENDEKLTQDFFSGRFYQALASRDN